MIKRIWALITGGRLVVLIDFDGLETITIARRTPTKSQAQLLERIAATLEARGREDAVIREQLTLMMQDNQLRAKRWWPFNVRTETLLPGGIIADSNKSYVRQWRWWAQKEREP